ncbi:MAG: hypothetical protein KatS3mg010_0490 [Acidimicrobiia bacterium]|jgi:DNA-directed RNA polymerase specialized sigma24 family protein|nr:MAG: hypothetical protein KatS3mg010_0490 [Acidimicrobiia bacterium]
MARSTLPLFPTDDGWPYPDASGDLDPLDDGEPDLDALELRVEPRAFAGLSDAERAVVYRRYGLDGGPPMSVKELAPALGCTRGEIRSLLGAALDKLRSHLDVR